MKVYATLLNDEGKVILKEWPSAKVFQANERWCDQKFLNVAKTSDLKGYEYYPAKSHRTTCNFKIVYTNDQIKSRILLYYKFHELRTKGAIK